MDEKTRKKIIDWIFKNHEHHQDIELDTGIIRCECEDDDYPYVNSLKLERFIKRLK